MKKKNTEKTIFKTDMIKGVLVFSFSNFFTDKIPREGNWVRFSYSNSALATQK